MISWSGASGVEMDYEPVIGLEVHAQLKTNSKIFCGCPTNFGAEANEQTCPVCLGMPGVLPVLNKKVLEFGIKCGIALNCEIPEVSKFDRKNYFYADLPKDYQISQFDQPVCGPGYLQVGDRKIGIVRAHLEEDAGKLVHAGAAGLHGSTHSLVDFNRSGIPLLEIVSAPDIRSAEEAEQYLRELRNILRYLDVCDGNLQEGSFRCDANVSLRPVGDTTLGTKAEIKNMNSFNAVRRAIKSEIDRQGDLLRKGERVKQETRLWNEATQSTFSMRSKEDSHDYRYFPEPDLVPLSIDPAWVKSLQSTMPELPQARRQRYVSEAGLSADDAAVLVENKELADFYDQALNLGAQPKPTASMLLVTTQGYLNEAKKSLPDTPLTAQNLKDIVENAASGTLNSNTAKQILTEILSAESSKSFTISDLIKERGLAQVSDEGELAAIVEKVLTSNPTQLEDYRGGKTKVRQFFLGEVMKATKGKANPQIINKILDEKLPAPN